MNDTELRALVREAVARHLGRPVADGPAPPAARPPRALADPAAPHASHAVYVRVVNTTDACVIEPDVGCHHCDYCKSHGF